MRGAVFTIIGGGLIFGAGLVYAMNLRGLAARYAKWELARRARRQKVSELSFVHVRLMVRLAGGLVALFGLAALAAGLVGLLLAA